MDAPSLPERFLTLSIIQDPPTRTASPGVVGETLMTLANGTSVRVADLAGRNHKALTWNGEGIAPGSSLQVSCLGKQPCLRVTLMDGRTITCTSDSKFLVRDRSNSYSWKRVSEVDRSHDLIVCGTEAPEDVVGADEQGWRLEVEGRIFDMTPGCRDSTLAFARLLGFLNADGRLGVSNGNINCSLFIGNLLAVENARDDIELLIGVRPSYYLDENETYGTVYSVFIPKALSSLFLALPGQETGRRSLSPNPTWPFFLSERTCPRAVLREFAGGMMGGDGNAPCIMNREGRKDTDSLIHNQFLLMSTLCEHEKGLQKKLQGFCDILERLGIPQCYVSPNPTIISFESKSTKEIKHRAVHRVYQRHVSDCRFLEKVGFRYCPHKNQRLTASQTLWRFEETVVQQRRDTFELAKEIYRSGGLSQVKALEAAKSQMLSRSNILFPPAISKLSKSGFNKFLKEGHPATTNLRCVCDVPQTSDWLQRIGALHYFRDGAYALAREQMHYPPLFLPLLAVEEVGSQDTFSLPSASFVGNGIVIAGTLPSAPAVTSPTITLNIAPSSSLTLNVTGNLTLIIEGNASLTLGRK
jgi:hypothetical protein